MSRAIRSILVAYAVAGATALAVGYAVPFEHPIAVAFAADLAATCAVFAFSFAHRNSSFYDAYWSVAPPVIGAYFLLRAPVVGVDAARQGLVLGLVILWGARLTYNWYRGWGGLAHEDWRYEDLRRRSGRAYWLVSFAGIHVLPTLWVFLGCLPLYPALALGREPFGALDWIAAALTAAAIWIEARADKELLDFRRSAPRSGGTLDSGLWRLSRHPNYFGEMLFWWGLFLFGVSADASYWWSIVGAASITGMFRFVSLPLIEKRMRERHPDFEAYARRTPRVVPWPRERARSAGGGGKV